MADKTKRADYIRSDPEVEDLVTFLNSVMLVAAGGAVDLDDKEPVYVGVTVDRQSGTTPKASLAISQDEYDTRNSIINHSDDLLRAWYLEHNKEWIKSMAEAGSEYDEGWEGEVWQLNPDAFMEAMDQLDNEVLQNVTVDREF